MERSRPPEEERAEDGQGEIGGQAGLPSVRLPHERLRRVARVRGVLVSRGGKDVRRDWKDARAKIEREGRCRVCGHSRDVETAHVISRERDPVLVGPNGGEYRYVHPDSVVPLCGGFSEENHHGLYDAHALDLLPYLTQDEQERAVEDAGGIIAALNRVTGGKA